MKNEKKKQNEVKTERKIHFVNKKKMKYPTSTNAVVLLYENRNGVSERRQREKKKWAFFRS